MKETAGFSMVGAMAHTANTTATLQGYYGDHRVGLWPLAASHKKTQTLHHQASFWGISQIKDLLSNP